MSRKKKFFFNIGLPGRDGMPGLPGGKGFGKYLYPWYWLFSTLNLFFQMDHQVYQVVQVCFHVLDQLYFDQWFLFTGEKGEAGLPGPGFPGKRIFIYKEYLNNIHYCRSPWTSWPCWWTWISRYDSFLIER